MKFPIFSTLRRLAATALAAVCLAGVAKADLIDLGLFTLEGSLGNPDSEAAWIEGEEGLPADTLVFLFKDEDGAGEDGALDGSYFTIVYSADGTTATISWDVTGTGFEVRYVLVKDGTTPNPTPPPPSLHLYHLYGVTPDQWLVGGGEVTIDGEKEISHISFFGVPTTVPDGGVTVILLGLGLAAVAGFRRFSHC